MSAVPGAAPAGAVPGEGSAGAATPGDAGPGEGSIGEGSRLAVVVVASTSAAAGTSEDRTGPLIRDWLAARGFDTGEPRVVADGPPVGEAVRAALAVGAATVITTGGTGVSPSDRTPEEVAPLLDVELPGIAEEIRRRGLAISPRALITRGVAGFAGGAFVATLPGSPGGVRDGLDVLDGVLEHVIEQRTRPHRRH